MEKQAPTATQRTWLDDLGMTQEAFAADPYPVYRQWKETRPPVWQADDSQWMIQDYPLIRQVLTNASFGKCVPEPAMPPDRYRDLPDLPPSLLTSNPPEHTRLRAIIAQAFQPRHLARLQPFVQETAEALLTPMLRDGGGDFAQQFASPLPALVIAQLLGVPHGDHDQFCHWAQRIVQSLDRTLPVETKEAARDASWELADYLQTLVHAKRQRPGHDLLSDLIAMELTGDHLSAGELLSMAGLLLVAGHETTTNLLTLAILTQIQFGGPPIAGLEDWSVAVDEVLRFTSPVQFDRRYTLTPVQLGGVALPKDTWVMLAFGAANRDPEIFTEPETLSWNRTPNPHLAFGRGIHFCLGAGLARLEATVAFPMLFQYAWQLVGVPNWNKNIVLRGMRSLPVGLV